METLEFIIYPDGRVKETVTGIVGASCAEVTAAIEAQLGIVLTHEPTSEFFTNEVLSSDLTNTQSNYSNW
jgi:Holliday junction resolvasome RuvABC endonuclease subunit